MSAEFFCAMAPSMRALADAAAAEDADTLAETYGQQASMARRPVESGAVMCSRSSGPGAAP